MFSLSNERKFRGSTGGLFAPYSNWQFDDSLALSEILLQDAEVLIHKAVGKMLCEVGNRHRPTEATFLQQHYATMPPTMLRYAMEKFPERRRQQTVKGCV